MTAQFNLSGQSAIVTGAGRGLGEAIAKGLASAGAAVALCDMDIHSARTAADNICQSGGKAIAVEVNVSKADSVDQMVQTTMEQFGSIDILVNNAGIQRRNPCIDMSEQDWDAVIDVNLKGTFLCSRAVGRIMVPQRKGKIINISSLLGTVAQPNRGPYAASKGGVVQFTKVLALEWASHNINVNAVGPGYVLTELNTALMEDKEAFDELTSRIPMERWASTEDIVGPVLFLASNASDYITGHVLYVDGGYLCL